MDRLDRLKRIAEHESGDGFVYLHPGVSKTNGRPTHVLMTISRYNKMAERIWPGAIPEDDPEWAHEHAHEGDLTRRGVLREKLAQRLALLRR